MSGQKDVTIRAVDPALLEARRLAQQRMVEQRRQAEQAVAAASAELASASRQSEAAGARLAELRSRQREINSRLDQLSEQRRELNAQLRGMKREILEARDEAANLASRVDGDYRNVLDQIEQLNRLERELAGEEQDLERRIASFDGSEAAALSKIFQERDAHLQKELENMLGLEVAIQAYATDPVLGTVLYEMVDSARDLGFEISRVFTSAGEVEIFVTNAQKETIRLAAELKRQDLDQWTRDSQLRKLILHGEGHASRQSCLVETMALLERVRQKGIDLQLTVESPAELAERQRPRLRDSPSGAKA